MPGEEPLLAVAAALVTAAMIVIWVLYLRYFVIVPPNRAIVVYGRGAPLEVPDSASSAPGVPGAPRPPSPVRRSGALRIEVGGGVFVPPWTKAYELLPLNVLDIDTEIKDVVTSDREVRRVDASVAAEVKISADPEHLQAAAESLLGKSEDELKAIAKSIVEGYVRGEFARRTLIEINHGREKVAAEVQVLAATDLVSIGMVVKSLVVKGIRPAGGIPAQEAVRAAEARSTELEGLVWQLSAQMRKLELKVDALENGAVLVGRELRDLNITR